jgi:hypothetical protein
MGGGWDEQTGKGWVRERWTARWVDEERVGTRQRTGRDKVGQGERARWVGMGRRRKVRGQVQIRR